MEIVFVQNYTLSDYKVISYNKIKSYVFRKGLYFMIKNKTQRRNIGLLCIFEARTMPERCFFVFGVVAA